MSKTIKIDNIQGGVAPYEVELLPVGKQSSNSFNDVPNGIFRAKVYDASSKTTLPKTVVVSDASHNTDRNINWDKIPEFSLPASLTAVWGWGSPRWANEAQPTDAMRHGWTHSDNIDIDGGEIINAKRAKTIYFPFGGNSSFYSAINEVKSAHPTVVNAAIVQEYTIRNATTSAVNFTYINYLNQTVNESVPAMEGSVEEVMTVVCFFGTQPSNGNYNQGIVRVYNPDAVTDAAYVALGRAYYNQEKWSADYATGNLTAYRVGLLFYNEETLGNAHRANQLLFKGMCQEASSQSNPFKIIYYGKQFVEWGGGFYSGQQDDPVSWKQKVFPNLKSTVRITAEQLSQNADLTALGEAGGVILSSGFYFKVPFPQTNSKYEKQNGQYVIDQDGERKFRIGDFTENIRGSQVQFYQFGQGGEYTGADPAYGYPNNKVSEMFWAVTQFYAAASYLIFVNIALAKKYRGNTDIYTQFDDIPVKNSVTMRNETEGTFPSHAIITRPITSYQAEYSIFLAFALTETYYIWTDYPPVSHPAQGYPYVAINKGAGYPTSNSFLQFSPFEDFTWAMKYISYIDSQHGVFGNGNKKIIAYQPADTTHEIQIFGRIKSNKVWIFATEPRLDPDETLIVTLSNKKNTFSQQFAVKGGENFVDVFTLPSTDSYEPSDIIFSYKDIYNVQHSVTGDLRQHLATNVIVPPPSTGVSIFEFFPKSNGQAYPSGNQGNNYINFQFASWSIISSNAAITPTNVEAHVRCKLYDAANNLICNILDTKGNYHPNFAPYFPSGQDLRSNNHLPQYLKYLPFGAYRIEIENISVSNVTMKLRLGWAGVGGTAMELLNDEPLAKGATRTLNFNIGNTWTDGGGTVHNYTDGSNIMILNFNVYEYP